MISCGMALYEEFLGSPEAANFWILLMIFNYLNFLLQCNIQEKLEKAKEKRDEKRTNT